MGISGSYKDFQWEADINEEELELDSNATVTVTTPTGGTADIVMWGPWEDIDSFEQILVQDLETDGYLDIK